MPFEKGNKLAKGGARRGAGRKDSTVKIAMQEAYANRVPRALEIIDQALDVANEVSWKDRLQAAFGVLWGYGGKPRQAFEVTGGRRAAMETLDKMDALDVVREGHEAQRTSPTTRKPK